MSGQLRYPLPKDKVTACLFRQLIDLIRANTPIAGRNIRTLRTNHGTHISCVVPTTAASAPADPIRGCYCILGSERDGKPVHVFGNPYVMVGGVLTRHPVDTVVEDLLAEAGEEAEDGTIELFLALRILAAPPAENDPETDEDETEDNGDLVIAYANFTELTEAQRDASHHTIPLYLLSVTKTTDETSGDVSYGYEIACDFRRGVWAQQWEVFT